MTDTVPLEVEFDEHGEPTQISYHHMTFGLMKLSVESGVASLSAKWDRLGDKSLKDGYERWVSTGDVLRSVQQLPFINEVRADSAQNQTTTESEQ
ncbi:hypothetical protein HATV-3_gp47 [Haloarcula tailed virus 3]|uniref:Uncharacterized protein n=1 Tax=Haloarcula tailed virus 3 TaxID=2877990 RepID=A0AAE8XZU4_9CAUD|nr:hypothetical protein M1M35_gp47 [Haloarcula tailed virus 3]UBF23397.1 hypothetical protein HATV-3_gp47 [Haloarcula tailed virus 3]